MELELQGWKVKAALVALVALVVAVPLARAVNSNKSRAEDWHRRAVVAEESVAGLRAVIVERSRELNRRTIQANRLVGELDTARAALRRSKLNVGTLTRRQRELAQENARVVSERRKLQTRQAELEAIASKLSACTKGLEAAQGKRKISVSARARLASCRRAGASLDAYLERLR